jgi:hypothetical protein
MFIDERQRATEGLRRVAGVERFRRPSKTSTLTAIECAMRPNIIPSNRTMSREKTKSSVLPEILTSWSA